MDSHKRQQLRAGLFQALHHGGSYKEDLIFQAMIALLDESEERAQEHSGDGPSDREFLQGIHERLQHFHGESPSVDYMHKLRAIIAATPQGQHTPNAGS